VEINFPYYLYFFTHFKMKLQHGYRNYLKY